MNTFRLQIITCDRTFYEGKAQIVILPSEDGERAIMAHHEEMAISIEIGELRFQKEDGTWVYGVCSRGFANTANNRVSVYVYSCEHPEEIDIRRAKEAKENAEEQLRQKQSLVEYHLSQAELARAMARLKAAGKIHPVGY